MTSPKFVLIPFSLLVGLSLAGCGAGIVTDAPTTPTTTTPPVTGAAAGASGQNYGGHAPLVGAHIYLVQLGDTAANVSAGNTPQTYGSVVKSLLTIAGRYTSTPNQNGDTYPLVTNGSWAPDTTGKTSDQFVPTTDLVGQPFKGVLTNQFGEFYITGDYACTPGYPVMAIGYGGAPSYYGAGASANKFTVSQMQVQMVSGVNVFTYTTSTPELFYTGETVTVAGFTGGLVGYNQTGVVQASGLTSSQFTIVPTPAYTGGGQTASLQTAPAGVTATGTPAFNPAATNMAMLGLCPATGNFTPGQPGGINYIYMNEVSTTAAAYALAGFINTAATNQGGNDEFHIGAPVANLVGLQNAAVTAGLLYDIQGGNTGTNTVFNGENHVARSVTPCPATGMCAVGAVPQTQIDTIANALAACVDSNNTYRAGAGTQSTACVTLDTYAQDNGYYDTTSSTHLAFNIAQAAFNLARFPQGLGTATTSGGVQTLTAGTATTASNFTSAIFNLPAGSNVPFQPQLSAAPNDFSVAIQWNPANVAAGTAASAFTDVEIDSNGVAWAMNGAATNAGIGSTTAYQLKPVTTGGMSQSQYTAASGLSTALTAGLAIDASNTAWAPGLTGVYKFTPGTAAGAQLGATLSFNGGAIALDSSLNQYIPSGNDGAVTGGAASSITKVNAAGTAVATGYPINSITPGCPFGVGWTTVDTSGLVWTGTSVNNALGTTNYVCRFANAGGAAQFTFALPNGVAGQAGASAGTGFSIARGLATDKNDNAWFAEKNQDALYMVAKGSTTNTYSRITTDHFTSGGRLSAPRGIAIDGANTIWVSSTGDTTATITGGANTPKYATGLAQFSDTDVAITPSYITGAAAVSSATSNTSLGSVAIDPSGNVWSAQGSQTPGGATPVNPTLVYEYVGLATPTTTPIAYAKANGLVAAKPGLTSSAASVFRYPAGDTGATATLALGFSSAHAFYVGEVLLLSGFQTSTYLNGHMVKVFSIPDSQNLRVTFVDNYVPTTSATTFEVGAVSAVN